jgi:hypothetical protein
MNKYNNDLFYNKLEEDNNGTNVNNDNNDNNDNNNNNMNIYLKNLGINPILRLSFFLSKIEINLKNSGTHN